MPFPPHPWSWARLAVRYGVYSVPVLRLPHEPAVCRFGELRVGSDIMKKRLRRALERIRVATDGLFRRPTPVRGGLGEPQRMQAVPAPARAMSRRI